jgi:hypothetical protein
VSTFLERLRTEPRMRVELHDVQRHFYGVYPEIQASPERGARLLQALQALEAEGKVSLPAKAGWERIGDPPLPKWVAVTRAEARFRDTRDFSAVAWVPELGFWPSLKQQQLSDLERINSFLLERRGPQRLVPIKERSLQIFGDEKRLDHLRIGDWLFAGHLSLATLGAMVVAPPLPYRQADAAGRPVLVVENHNTFWSFGEWNHRAKLYSAVVYGEGEAFRSTGAALGQVLREVDGTSALYFGDLDVKGVRIPMDFNQAAASGSPPVQAATGLYSWLMANGRRREKLDCKVGSLAHAQAWLGAELGATLHALWQEGMWIPQEALGFEQLLEGAHPTGA